MTLSQANALTFEQLNNVNDIVQDKQGYIWLSGQHGISRYDGQNIINFAHNSQQWRVPFIWTHDISLDNEHLLITTETQGIWRINATTGATSPLTELLKNTTVYQSLAHDNGYFIYTVSPKKIFHYSPSNEQLSTISSNMRVTEFFTFKGQVYFYNSDGIFNIVNGTIVPFFERKISKVTVINNAIIAIDERHLYALSDSAQIMATTWHNGISAIAPANDQKRFFIVDESGNIAVYDQNLILSNHHFQHQSDNRILQLFHDNSDNLWLVGANTIERVSRSSFTAHQSPTTSKHELLVAQLQQQLIVASYGNGLHNFDTSQPVLPTNINDNKSKNFLRVMDAIDVAGNLYIATFDGLWRYRSASKTMSQVDIINNQQILLKLSSKGNLLYIATDENGFIIYNTDTEQVQAVVDSQYPFSSSEIIDILPMDDKTLWLATAKGLDIYHPNTDTIENIDLPLIGKVISLTQLQNKVYVATKGNGIFVFDKKKNLLTRIASSTNFGYIRALNNLIWAPTRQGIFTISPESYQISLVPGTENYNFTGPPISFENKIYAPYFGGVLEIPLAMHSHYDAAVYVSSTTVSGNTTIGGNAIEVASPNDVVTLNLASIDYRLGKEKRFQYQINDKAWNDITANQLTLTGLASGNYQIIIRGTNSLGQWSKHQAFVTLDVAYPWYWQPRLRIVYLVTMFASIFMALWLFYLRAQSIKQIHQILSADIKKRGKASLNLSKTLTRANELLANYSSNIQESTELQSHQNNESNFSEAQEIIQQAIAELDSQSDNDEPDSLQGKSLEIAIPYLADYIHHKYHIRVQTKLDIEHTNLSYELQADIYKIVYEALTSAIVNGDGSVFTITMQEFKDKLWLTIRDDKTSFIHFKNKINFNMAMYYIRQIAGKYSASINTFDEQEDGSQLVVSIPLMPIS